MPEPLNALVYYTVSIFRSKMCFELCLYMKEKSFFFNNTHRHLKDSGALTNQ